MLNPAPADFIASPPTYQGSGIESPPKKASIKVVLWQELDRALNLLPNVGELGACETEGELMEMLLDRAASTNEAFFHPNKGNM